MFGTILSALGGWKGYAAAAGLAGVLAAFGAGYIVHKVDESVIANIKLAGERAEVIAIHKALAIRTEQDNINQQAAVSQALEQGKLEGQRQALPERIVVHVQDKSRCITYGLVRVLDGAAKGGSDPAVSVAPGKPDDACAPVTWRSFAADLADDYVTSYENAGQLNALEANVKALHGAAAH